MQENLDFIEENQKCPYFDNEISDTHYKCLQTCSSEEYQNMLEHGWRRFGQVYFVPVCKNCKKCISIRIDVKNYKFSKSDKRILAKNSSTVVYAQSPSLSIEHLNLYNKYHEKMNEKKSWPYKEISALEYKRSYVDGKLEFAKEFLYVRDGKLVGVALTDVIPQAISSIYCFYDHDCEKYSIGKFSILMQIKVAKELKIPYIYLGYWIKEHFSMGYKVKYQPFEVLTSEPSLSTKTIWQKYKE